jgi:hypothetical protein
MPYAKGFLSEVTFHNILGWTFQWGSFVHRDLCQQDRGLFDFSKVNPFIFDQFYRVIH